MATLLYFAPATVTNTDSNGGRVSGNELDVNPRGLGNFPTVSPGQLLAGVINFRKVFAKIHDITNPVLVQAIPFLYAPSLSDDTRTFFMAGTQRDTQADIGAYRRYAAGKLHTAISQTDTVLVVDFEPGSGADNVVQAGDMLVMLDGETESYDSIVDSVTWAGDQATITLTAGVLNSFSTDTVVCSTYVNTADVNPGVSDVVKDFSSSTYDDTTWPVLTNNVGTVEQSLLITITGADTFSCVSDAHGALADGSTLADYAPVNIDNLEPYFTLSASGWGGTQTVGETLSFQTHPAAVPVWIGKVVSPAATGGLDEVFFDVDIS